MALNVTSLTTNRAAVGVIDPISDRVRDISLYINFVALSTTIGVFGFFTNVINIIVFKRLGFKESMNVNLFAISISDMGSLVTLLWTCVLANPGLIAAPVDFIPIELAFLTGGIPHTRFTRISCWLTVLVTVERCMSLVAPLKVKAIFTPRSSTISAVVIFVFFLLTQILNNFGNRLDWKFDEAANRSRIGIVPSDLLVHTRKVSVSMSIVLQFLSLFAILASNFTLLYFLKRKATWWSRISGPAELWRSRESANGRLSSRFCCLTKTTPRLNLPTATTTTLVVPRSSIEVMPGDNTRETVASRYLTPPTPGFGALSTAFMDQERASPLSNVSPENLPAISGTVGGPRQLTGSSTNVKTSSTIMAHSRALVSAAETSSSMAMRRDQRLCRMILLLSAIMTFAILPSTICLAIILSSKQFAMAHELSNSFLFAYSIVFVFEATNASVNIFLYYMMSSKYRCALDKMMLSCKRKNRRVGDVGVRQ